MTRWEAFVGDVQLGVLYLVDDAGRFTVVSLDQYAALPAAMLDKMAAVTPSLTTALQVSRRRRAMS